MATSSDDSNLEIDQEYINIAFANFLEEKGYSGFNNLTASDIRRIADTGKIVIKITKNNETPEKGYIFFPSAFLSRVASTKVGLGIFINNIAKDQLQKLAKQAFIDMPEKDQKLLSFAFELNDRHKPGLCKKIAEIKDKFDFDNPRIIIGQSIREFGLKFYGILLEALENGSLTLLNDQPREKVFKISIINAGFNIRTQNCFKGADIKTIEDVYKFGRQQLKTLRNFGELSLNEVEIFECLYGIGDSFP